MTRDETIKGLLDAAVYLRQEADRCINTRFSVDVYRWTDSIMEAVKLLKAQEPRVLTADEIIGDGECWLESKNGASGYADCYMCTGRNSVEVWRCMAQEPSYLSWNGFNKTWRCWTSRPSDEQRKAVKWDV